MLAQLADMVLESFEAPAWTMKALLIALAAGFPIALFVSWMFEVTTRGVTRESEIDRTVSATDQSSERLVGAAHLGQEIGRPAHAQRREWRKRRLHTDTLGSEPLAERSFEIHGTRCYRRAPRARGRIV